MTQEEGIKELIRYCEDEIKNSGWLLFNKKRLQFERTRKLEAYERNANLSLPLKLEIHTIVIDHTGIDTGRGFFAWNEICATGIKSEVITIDEFETRYIRFLLVCLNTGEILNLALNNIDHLKGLLGHFIELYKAGA